VLKRLSVHLFAQISGFPGQTVTGLSFIVHKMNACSNTTSKDYFA